MYEDLHEHSICTAHEVRAGAVPPHRSAPGLAGQPRVSVRRAAPADYESVRRGLRAAYAQYDADIPIDVYGIYLASLLDLDTHAALGRLLVAECDGREVGTAACYPDSGRLNRGWPA